MDYGILACGQFRIERSGRARYSVGQVRVLKDALEARWKREIATEECVVPWIVEWAAHTLNRFEVGKDGRTAFERRKGKKARHLGIEFGEAVLWRRKPVVAPLGSYP